MLISAVVGILFCLCRNCSKYPNFCLCFGFLIPVGVYGFIRQLEFESLESDETQTDKQPQDPYLIKTIFFTLFIVVLCIGQCCLICVSSFTSQHIARRIDTTASDQQEEKNRQQARELEMMQQ